jgi:hypothetical protein
MGESRKFANGLFLQKYIYTNVMLSLLFSDDQIINVNIDSLVIMHVIVMKYITG